MTVLDEWLRVSCSFKELHNCCNLIPVNIHISWLFQFVAGLVEFTTYTIHLYGPAVYVLSIQLPFSSGKWLRMWHIQTQWLHKWPLVRVRVLNGGNRSRLIHVSWKSALFRYFFLSSLKALWDTGKLFPLQRYILNVFFNIWNYK